MVRQPRSPATSSERRYAEARSSGSPCSPSRKTGPTAWTTYLAGSRPAPVAFASPVAQPPRRAHSSKISSPPARRIAPHTPAPGPSASFAAFTIASTRSSVRSPTTNERDTRSEELLEPDGQARRQRADLLEREQHAGDERLARGRVMADRERLPRPAEDHLLVGDEPRKPHGVDDGLRAHARRGRLRGPRRRVALGVGVELDDLRL